MTINCASEGTVKRVKDGRGRGAMDEEGKGVREGMREVSEAVLDLLPLFQEGNHMKERRQAVDRKIINIPLSPVYHQAQCEHKSADSDKMTHKRTHVLFSNLSAACDSVKGALREIFTWKVLPSHDVS